MSEITQMATYAELRELALLSEASIDLQIQYWLTVTFATIVASFAARNALTRKLRLIVTALYLTATFMFVSRWYYKAIDLFQYSEMLEGIGGGGPIPVATIVSRIVLMLLGTLATVYFVYFRASRDNDEDHK